MEEKKATRKSWVGKVMSNKMDKTVVVMVERLIQEAKYRKYVRRRNTFKAHDEQNACSVGDQRAHRGEQAYQQGQALAGCKDPGQSGRLTAWRLVSLKRCGVTNDSIGNSIECR